MTYQIAIGHNNAAGLADMLTQPACDGINYPEYKYLPDGTVEPIGFGVAALRYEALDEENLSPLLTQCGLSDSIASAAVTIRLPNLARTFGNYNAYIVRPLDLKYRYWYNGLVFEIRRVVPI